MGGGGDAPLRPYPIPPRPLTSLVFNETKLPVEGRVSYHESQDHATLPWVPNYFFMILVVLWFVYGVVRLPCLLYACANDGGDEDKARLTNRRPKDTELARVYS